MAQVQPLSDAGDRVMSALIAGLEIEFGARAGTALAQRFIEAEEADFRWDARVEERWIDCFDDGSDEDFELDRVRIIGVLDARWFVATMIVDGDGHAQGMLGNREFPSEIEARKAFADA